MKKSIVWCISFDIYASEKDAEEGEAEKEGCFVNPEQLSFSVRGLIEKELQVIVASGEHDA